MPTALVPPPLRRIILRPEPPSSPCSGSTFSTGRRKCSSKRRFKMSMNSSPAPQSWATAKAASFLPQVVHLERLVVEAGAELDAINLSSPEPPEPHGISYRIRAIVIIEKCPPAEDATGNLI